MAPAYRNTPKGIVLPTGARINYGQMFPPKEGKPMQKNVQRPLNSSMHRDKIGRDGRVEKRIVAAPPVIGQRRQTKGDLHPYLHGVALRDEPNVGLKSYERGPAPIHNGISEASRQKFERNPANSSSLILADASRLGKPPEKA